MGCNCGPYQPDGCGNTIAGQLVPPGGTEGQHLAKASDGAFDVAWVDPPTGTDVDLTGLATSQQLGATNVRVGALETAVDELEVAVATNGTGIQGLSDQIQSLEIDPSLPEVNNYVLKYDSTLDKWTAGPPVEVPPGSGTGDMMQAVYDLDGDGVVDNAEALGGFGVAHFATADHNHDGVYSPVDHVHQDYEDGITELTNTANDLQDQIDGHETRITDLENEAPSSGGTNLHFGAYILASPSVPEWGDPIGVYDPDASVVAFDSKALLNPVVPSGSAYPGNVGYMHEYFGNRIVDSSNGDFHFNVNGTDAAYAVPASTGVNNNGNAVVRTTVPVVPVPKSPAELVYLENVSVVPIDSPSSGFGVPYFRMGPTGLNLGTPPQNSGGYNLAYAWPVVGTVSGWFPARSVTESPNYGSGNGPGGIGGG
jgi:hypothetical protein